MNQPKPQLDIYFFPVQEVNANPTHNPSDTTETVPKIDHRNGLIDGNENAMWVEVSIKTDEEESVNPSYFFSVLCFVSMRLIRNEDGSLDEQYKHFSTTSAIQLAIGAIREHLAAMTARGPWGPLMLGPTILKPSSEFQPPQEGDLDKN